jgi:hypothetical protein
MTMKQKKGIRAVVLTLLFLLLAIGTFDSRHGNLAAQSESSDIASAGNMDLRKAEASLPAKVLATAQAPPKIVEIERVVEVEKIVEKEDDPHLVKKPDPVPEPEPKPDPGDEPGSGAEGDGNRGHDNDEAGPGVEGDGNRGHGNDEDGYDEDNPGQGGFGGVGSSSGRGGHRGSGGSDF